MDRASQGPSTKTAYTVTMLASPSFTPGMGMGTGIWASTIKMVRAMAVSRASRVRRRVPLSCGGVRMALPPCDLKDDLVGQADHRH